MTKKELEKLELRKSNLQNDLMDRVITSQDYQDMKGKVDKDIILLKDKLTELQVANSPFKLYIQKEVPMLENLLEFYRKSDGKTKMKILNSIFAEKLILEKGKVLEPSFSEPVQLIFMISEVLGRNGKNTEIGVDHSLVATLTNNPVFRIQKLQPFS